MLDCSTVSPMAMQANTLDLYAHPLAATGLHPRYWVRSCPVSDGEEPPRNAFIEVLIHQSRVAEFTGVADALGETAGLPRPACDVATDYGGGTWRLVEIVGPRALIGELMVLAQDCGCERMSFPH